MTNPYSKKHATRQKAKIQNSTDMAKYFLPLPQRPITGQNATATRKPSPRQAYPRPTLPPLYPFSTPPPPFQPSIINYQLSIKKKSPATASGAGLVSLSNKDSSIISVINNYFNFMARLYNCRNHLVLFNNSTLDSIDNIPNVIICHIRPGRQTHTNLEQCLTHTVDICRGILIHWLLVHRFP